LAAESRNRLCGFFPCALLLAGVLQLLSLQLKLGLALLDLLLAGFFFRLLLPDFFPLLPLEPRQRLIGTACQRLLLSVAAVFVRRTPASARSINVPIVGVEKNLICRIALVDSTG
jgi:hypothetical protein